MLALTEKQALIQALGQVVFEEVKAAVAPLNDRVALLEKAIGDLAVTKAPPLGEAQNDGPPPVDVEFLRQYVAGALEAFKKDAANDPDGADGKSLSLDDIRTCCADLIAEAVGNLPLPAHPVSWLIDRAGALCFSNSDGTIHTVGQVVGRDGKDGAPGLKGEPGMDGVGFEALEFQQIDQRNFRLVIGNTDGSKLKTFNFTLPGQIQRGMWNDETEYDPGDCVTLNGSQWCARVANKASRPETDNEQWYLTVKRGRDGNRGPPGAKGEAGQDGRPGRDLTQMTFDGQKY